MSDRNIFEHPWVLARLNEVLYGFPIDTVRELLTSHQATAIPGMSPADRGIVNLRGKICRLIDTRLLFGQTSLLAETRQTIQMFQDRETDHRNWMQELEKSVAEKRDFKGQLDPHRCAFGIWYDRFTTDNAFLNRVLKQFDEPHRKIHAIGHQVNQLIAAGSYSQADAVIAGTRSTHLNRLFELFEEARQTIIDSQREVMIVLEINGKSASFTVDSAESVEYLDPVEVNTDDWGHTAADVQFITSTARRRGSEDLVLLLNPESLLIS